MTLNLKILGQDLIFGYFQFPVVLCLSRNFLALRLGGSGFVGQKTVPPRG